MNIEKNPSDFAFLIKQIWVGKTIARSFFNNEMRRQKVYGKVVDVGSGPKPYYQDYFQKTSDTVFESIDPKIGSSINFETDALPFASDSFDMVLSMNVMEHIYNYEHLFKEMVRILKPNGEILLFVPFLYVYHPEPGASLDCFRFTRDALERLSNNNGLTEIKIEEVGGTMFIAGANLFLPSVPKFLRFIFFIPVYLIDLLVMKIKPAYKKTFPIGYVLRASKIKSV